MTVKVQYPIAIFEGNGTASPLNYDKRFLDSADLIVTHIAVSGDRTILLEASDYTVSGAGDPDGGQVVPISPIAIGDKWEIARTTPLMQPTDYSDTDGFPADSHELALDRQMLILQEQSARLDRTPKVAPGETGPAIGVIDEGQVLAMVAGEISGVDNDPVAAESAAARAEIALADTQVVASEVSDNAEQVALDKAQVAMDKLATDAAVVEAGNINQAVSDALAVGTISDLVGTRIYASKALLEADLVPADNEYALVVGDATAANNDLYQKNGATTTGSWDGPLGFFAAASAEAQASAERAKASADTVTADNLSTQIVGTVPPVTGGGLATTDTYIIRNPVAAAGFLSDMTVFGLGAGVMKVKRYSLSAGTFTFQSEISLPFTTGLNTVDLFEVGESLDLQAGDYLGFFQDSGQISAAATSANSTPYFASTGDNTTTIPEGAPTGTAALQINFTVMMNRKPLDNEIDGRTNFLGIGVSVPQEIGTPSPVTGSTLGISNTYVINSPASRVGYVESINLFALRPGSLLLKIFSRNGNDFTFQNEVLVPFVAGLNNLAAFRDFEGLNIEAGDYLGFYVLAGSIAFTATSNTTPYYNPSGNETDTFTAGTLVTANRIAINFGLTGNSLSSDSMKDEYRSRLNILESGKDIATITVGTANPVDALNLAVAPTYLINVPMEYAGFTDRLVVWGRTAGVLKLKRFKKVSGDFVFQNEVSIPFAVGLNDLSGWADFDGLAFDAGDYLAIFQATGQIAVTISVANNTPYYPETGDVTGTFTPGSLNTSNRVEIGIITKQGAPSASGASADIVALPPVLYGITGHQMNAYLDSFVFADGGSYAWDVTGTTRGAQQEERWYWNPNAAVDETLNLHLINPATGVEQDMKTTQIMTADYPPAIAKSWTALIVGDSLVANGEIAQELINLAGAGVSNTTLALIGTRGTGPALHEGRGGYTVEDYATAGRVFQSFTVTGVVEAPVINSTESVYTHNGRSYTPQDINLDGGGNGTITCSYTGGSVPSASGTLTKVGSGAGDAAITFTATAPASGNPFWDGGAASLDFDKYLTDNSLSTPDYVFFVLGINGIVSQATDGAVDARIASDMVLYEDLVAHFLATNASIKVVPTLTTRGSVYQSAAGSNYGTSISQYRAKRNLLRMAQAMVDQFGGREAERIYLAATNAALDPVHGYPTITGSASSRNAATVTRGTNLVHPNTSGSEQMADAIYALMQVVGA